MNDLTLDQSSTILNSIMEQATGKSSIAATNTSEFVTVGQTALKMGYDPLLGAISQVLSRTWFSINPYNRKLGSLKVTNQQYGNMRRKIAITDKDFEDDERLPLTDNVAVDMYKVNKPVVNQLNFYGAKMYQRHYTVFIDQLDTAMSGPEEFASFISMLTTNNSDIIEQAHETFARGTIANMAGGIISEDDSYRIVHLLTEYNTLTGLTLTAATVYQPDNFVPFIRWVYARMATISSKLTERSLLFHTNITDYEVSRHTPKNIQKLYILSSNMNEMNAMVLANTFHENKLQMPAVVEELNFWQSIESPDQINVTPTYLGTDGVLVTPETAVSQSNVFGILFDEKAMGYTTVNTRTIPTPVNAAGGYSNMFHHFTDQNWNDFTENAVVFLLD